MLPQASISRSVLSKIVLAALFVLALSARAEAVVALCNGANNGANNGGTTNTVSWTFDAQSSCAGANYLLVVQIEGDTGSDDVTGCTYNGTSMTFRVVKFAGGAGRYTRVYTLADPDAGANTVTCTASTTHYLFGVATSYTGVTGVGATDGGTCSSCDHITGTITTTQANSWIYAGASSSNVSSWSAGTNAVLRGQYVPFSSPAAFDTGAPQSVALQSMVANTGATGDIAITLVELKTGTVSPTSGGRLLLMGVGDQ